MIEISADFIDKTCQSFSNTPVNKHHWSILSSLWTYSNPLFYQDLSDTEGYLWIIKEIVANQQFYLTRNCVTLQRITHSDPFGLIGLSLINPQDKSVILTEGVSDYFSVKLLYPHNNVLGITTLGGNFTARQLLLNLFDEFVLCADNDIKSSFNTGLSNAFKLKSFLESFNKRVKIFIPPYGKDMSDTFIQSIRNTY